MSRRSLFVATLVVGVGCFGAHEESRWEAEPLPWLPPGEEPPPRTEPQPPEEPPEEPPPELPTEEPDPDLDGARCLAVVDGVATYVDMGTGALTRGPRIEGMGYDVTSVALHDHHLYFCSYSTPFHRASLADGASTELWIDCSAVTGDETGLWFQPFGEPLSIEHRSIGADGAILGTDDTRAVSYAVSVAYGNGALVTSMHSSDRVEVHPLDGSASRVVVLEGYDDWIGGLGVLPDGRIVIGTGWNAESPALFVFDGASGEQLASIPLGPESRRITGVVCGSGADFHPPAEGEVPELAREPALPYPPSLNIGENCAGGGDTSSNFVHPDAPIAGDEELHIVSAHEGDVRVRVHRTDRPAVLFLWGYRATWNIELDAGANLSRVVVWGYEASSVSGIPSGLVESLPPGMGVYAWERDAGRESGARIEDFLALVRDATGLTETSFQGCYSGAQFEVPEARLGP